MEPFVPDSLLVIFGQLSLALLLGLLLGTERSVVAGKRAGSRTFALVALGSCLFTVTGIQVTHSYLGLINFDPMRIAAAIITGIGFIGAGIIIFRGDELKGLTTAAGLWVSSGIGIATAFGLYAIAIFSTLLALLAFTALWFIEDRLKFWTDTTKKAPVVVEREEGEER